VKDVMRQIVDLCELDRQLHGVREQLQRYPAMLREMDARQKKAAQRVAEITKRHKEAREGRRQAELDAAGYREKIQKYKIQQGSVKTNRELEAITHEIESLEARIDAIETFGLELLEREETAQQELAEAEEARRELTHELDAERDRIADQTERKRLEMAELVDEQAHRAVRLPEDVRDIYALLNQKYPGTAAVAVKDGACGGCSMKLVTQRMGEVRRAEALVRCDNCTRMLYDPAALGAPGVRTGP
jgi:uncharacterized protein